MMETLRSSSYHNRFIRQFDIPIGKTKRNSYIAKRLQRSGFTTRKVEEYAAAASSNLDLMPHASSASRRNNNTEEGKSVTGLQGNGGFVPSKEETSMSPLMAYFGAAFGKDGNGKEFPLNDLWLAQMLEGLNHCLKNEQSLGCSPASLYAINPACSDKVDGAMRDDAIFNLLFLHKAFCALSPLTFCRAVHIVDQFIVRVKVKPKYMACVTAAAYLIAAELHEKKEECPTAEDLVNLTQCGGTVEDMGRMTAIIRSKLQHFVLGSTAMDYLKVFARLLNFVVKASREKVSSDAGNNPMLFHVTGEAHQRVSNRILVSLTSFQSREFSSACLALASLWLEWSDTKLKSDTSEAVVTNVFDKLARLCQIPWEKLQQCAHSVYKIYQVCYDQALPCSREQLFWCLSRRTRNNLGSMSLHRCSAAARLQSISEEEEIANTGICSATMS